MGFPTSFWSSLPLPRSWRPGRLGTPSTWPCSPPASCTRRGNRSQGARDRPWVQPEATLKRRKKMGRVQQEKWRFHPFTHQKWRFHHEKLRFHHEKLGFTMKNGGVRTKHMGIADEAMDWGKGKSLKKGCFYQPNIGGSCRCCLQLSLESKDALLHVCSVCVWVAHCKKLCHRMILSLQQR